MKDDRQNPWAVYRHRRLAIRVALLVSIAALVGWILYPSAPTFGLCVVSGIVFVVTVQRLMSWRCPRCDQAFFRKGPWHNGFAGRCMNCELPKWSSDTVLEVAPHAEASRE
jgi:hypothetical protein